MSDPLKDVREQLAKFIKDNYATMEKFCWHKKVNKSTVSNFLADKKDFQVSTLLKLAEAMGKKLNINFVDQDTVADSALNSILKTILVIDDDPVARTMTQNLLSKLGHNVITESNGQDGMRLALGARPDVIIMDLLMEGVDGFEATKRLKLDQVTRHIPIIAVTAYGDKRDLAEKAGIDSFQVKPVNIDVLSREIRRLSA